MNVRNQLLSALPERELEVLAPHLERGSLRHRQTIYDPGVPIPYAVFPETSLVSIVNTMSDGAALEAAVVGFEGMASMPLFHGVESAREHAFVQVPGEAYRIDAGTFRTLLPALPTLVERLHRFAAALFTMVSQTSACERRHAMQQRCARWLLYAHDRVDGDRVEMTQHFLALMLGVRRATVTVAASALQEAGLIDYSRGKIVVCDRAGLERAACECYDVVRDTYSRLLGVDWPGGEVGAVRTSMNGFSVVGRVESGGTD